MHELFALVLRRKDLSKAGDLFSVDDKEIANELSEVLDRISTITDAPEYVRNTNDQSVVEICITRVTSAIRETGTIEKHSVALVRLLESCLKHNLRPQERDIDPPHAKIASDIMSCIFLNYSKKHVMEMALPIAVKFLHQGNKELSRNLSSYLSLAAIDNAPLLARHLPPIIESIITGNKNLTRVLPQIYPENKGPISEHISGLIHILPDCEASEKNSILQLCGLVAKDQPKHLEKHIGQFCAFLQSCATSPVVLQMYADMAAVNAEPFVMYTRQLKQTAEQQPATLTLVCGIVGAVGKLSQSQAKEAVDYLVIQLENSDNNSLPVLLKEIKSICDIYPAILPDYIGDISRYRQSGSVAARLTIEQLRDLCAKGASTIPHRKAASSQTEGVVTIVTVGNPPSGNKGDSSHPHSSTSLASIPNLKKHASTSTREIHFPATPAVGPSAGTTSGSVSILTMPRPPSIVKIPTQSRSSSVTQMPLGGPSPERSVSTVSTATSSHFVSPTPQTIERPSVVATTMHHHNITTFSTDRSLPSQTQTKMPSPTDRHTEQPRPHHERPPFERVIPDRDRLLRSLPGSQTLPQPLIRHTLGGVGSRNKLDDKPDRKTVPQITPITSSTPAITHPVNAIPFRDAVQQFCEKHLDSIKTYISQLNARLPIPIKATLDETKHKKHCKLHFICFGRGEHCLYGQAFFTVRTKLARTWIHLIFLAIQSRSSKAVSQQEPSVGNLKACWDSLKTDAGNSFIRVVTSAFPSQKDQDALLHELNNIRYFDVFEYNAEDKHWACFMCNHPERATDFLQEDGLPTLEGKLKEKKGRWKALKRWKTRHFTLSGAAITYSKKDKQGTLPVNKIQSVKAVKRGHRDIPKAFEIFTKDDSYVFKAADSKNAEQWVQCLQIALAKTKNTDTREGLTEFDIKAWDFVPARNHSVPLGSRKQVQTKL